MRVSMTKARVLKALREQPVFTQGRWCAASWEGIKKCENDGFARPLRIKDDPGCQVCAVGAVVRHLLDPNTRLKDVDDVAFTETAAMDAVDGDPTEALEAGQYLTALSRYFEQMPYNSQQATIRCELLAFVTKHFPAKIVVDINGYRRRRGLTGVKVVR